MRLGVLAGTNFDSWIFPSGIVCYACIRCGSLLAAIKKKKAEHSQFSCSYIVTVDALAETMNIALFSYAAVSSLYRHLLDK